MDGVVGASGCFGSKCTVQPSVWCPSTGKLFQMSAKFQLSEQAMQSLEVQIPLLAGPAFQRAYYQALTQSGKVLEAVNGQLVETSVDGSSRFIRSLPPSIKVTSGTRVTRQVNFIRS